MISDESLRDTLPISRTAALVCPVVMPGPHLLQRSSARSVEGDYLTHRPSLTQVIEAFVDLIEPTSRSSQP